MAKATHSKSAKLEIKKDAAFIQVKGLKDFGGIGSGEPSEIDITDLDSTAKEFLTGLADEGTLNFGFNHDDTDPGQIAMDAARTNGTVLDARIILSTGKGWAFKILVKTWEISGGVDQTIPVACTARITGAVTKYSAA